MSPAVTEAQIAEANRQFHAPSSATSASCGQPQPSSEKQGNKLSRRPFSLLCGGQADHSTRITASPTMFHTPHEQGTL